MYACFCIQLGARDGTVEEDNLLKFELIRPADTFHDKGQSILYFASFELFTDCFMY